MSRYHKAPDGSTRILILLLLAILVLTSGCQDSPESGSTQDVTVTTADAGPIVPGTSSLTAAATTTPASGPTSAPTSASTTAPALPDNPLTGLPLTNAKAVGQRPIAIMINNIKIATPQIGISQADLIYELPVEAGITRMMAVFADIAAIPEIGSIRSARHDYIDLAGSLDAILVHFGASNLAYDQFARQKTAHLDLGSYPDAFWRDQQWREDRGSEHSVKATGSRLQKALGQAGYRTALRKGQKSAFLFRNAGDFAAASGKAAGQVSIPYSTNVTATFTYDAATRLYSKGQFGKPHLDLSTGQPIQFTNLLLLVTRIVIRDDAGHRDAALAKGSGYYVSGGQWQPIKWQKGDTAASFVFRDSSGQELSVNRGKSYIGIIPDTSQISLQP